MKRLLSKSNITLMHQIVFYIGLRIQVRSPIQNLLDPFLNKFDTLCSILNTKFKNVILCPPKQEKRNSISTIYVSWDHWRCHISDCIVFCFGLRGQVSYTKSFGSVL